MSDSILAFKIGGPEIILILFFGIVPAGLMIFSLLDILKSRFKGNAKSVWIAIVLLLPVLGALLYLLLGRTKKIS